MFFFVRLLTPTFSSACQECLLAFMDLSLHQIIDSYVNFLSYWLYCPLVNFCCFELAYALRY